MLRQRALSLTAIVLIASLLVTACGRWSPVPAQMTLAEKIGQMTQVESDSITPDEVTAYAVGSVLTSR